MRRELSIVFLLVLSLFSFSPTSSFGQFKVIGYLPAWGGYPNSIDNVDLTKVTHINIAFANPDASGNLVTTTGSLANLATVVTTAHNANVKVLMSIGGAGAGTNPLATRYRDLIVNDLSGFVSKIVQYSVDNNLDGIDVDLEGDLVDGSKLTDAQYESFIVALEVGLHAQNKLMTAALATWFASHVTNTAASKFDFINVMSYDAYGTWTGPGQHAPYDLAVSDFNYWNSTKGVAASKLTVGVPFYGYYWGTSSSSLTYSQIISGYPGAENTDKVIPSSGGIVYHNGIPTIKQKTVFALENAGGIMIWQLMGDASNSKSLLKAIDEVIQGYSSNVDPTVSITDPVSSTIYTEGDTVTIVTDATDTDGSIMKVEFYAGTLKIGELYNSPYTFKWTGAGAGTYSLTALATDNIGSSVTSAAVSITVNAAGESLPFTGTAIPIPGKVEAENFNLGGNNVGYYDLTTVNSGGAYRTTRVDIEECVDNGGGYDVGWTQAGEWLEYTVDITASGKYNFQSRVATQNSGKNFYIQIDGVNVTGTINVPNTTGWQKWQTVTTSNIQLTQGIRKMRIYFATADFNINYVNIVSAAATPVIDYTSTDNRNFVYPNPVTEKATIQFYLNAAGRTNIALFDEMGREVLILGNESLAQGSHEIALPKNNLPTGLYFCKISGETDSILIKVKIE